MDHKRTLTFSSEITTVDLFNTTETSAFATLNVHQKTKIASALGDLCVEINKLLESYNYAGKAKLADGDTYDEYVGKDISAFKYRAKAQFEFGKMAMKASDKAWDLMNILEEIGTECNKNGLWSLAGAKTRDEQR